MLQLIVSLDILWTTPLWVDAYIRSEDGVYEDVAMKRRRR